jgi:oligopeptide transport system substrate-binding protein
MKILIAFFILTIFLTSCQKKENQMTPQILRLNFQEGDVPSLNPRALMSHIRGHMLGKALFESLTYINENEEAVLAGAKKVEISDCKTQYLFTLRPHHWSSGKPVTAYQYEEAWKKAIDPASSCMRADFFYVIKNARDAKKGKLPLEAVGVKALDENQLLIELEYPAPYFLHLISQPFFAPVIGEDEPLQFNGPFMVDAWIKDKSIVLKSNPFFWDHKNDTIQRIEISMVTDPSSILGMYERNEIDWIGDPFSKISNETLYDFMKKGMVEANPSARFFWIYLNTQHLPLSSKYIREALHLSLNRNEICEHVLIGDRPLYTPLPDAYTLKAELSKEDTKQAQIMFQKGLEELNITRNTFPSLTLDYFALPSIKTLAEYLKQRWESVLGIKVKLQGAEWNVFRSNLEKGIFQIGGCYGAPLIPDPIGLLERFEDIESRNFSQWFHEKYGLLLTEARKSADHNQRNDLLFAAEKILAEEIPFIPVSNQVHFFICNQKLKGFLFGKDGHLDFRKAYLEK